jgi:hypothetical protein
MFLNHVLYLFSSLNEELTVPLLFFEPLAVLVDADPVGKLKKLGRLVEVEDISATHLIHFR